MPILSRLYYTYTTFYSYKISTYLQKDLPTGGLLYKFYRFDSYVFYFLSKVQLKDVICKFWKFDL